MSSGAGKPAARDVMSVTGTSVTVSAGSNAWYPETGGCQIPLLLGFFSDN
ncbi:hypothetical protein GM524_12720, partial [Streptococcus pneumoniae]|nr:hypothetical protein [Streptococcus pneumoniae]